MRRVGKYNLPGRQDPGSGPGFFFAKQAGGEFFGHGRKMSFGYSKWRANYSRDESRASRVRGR